jgi:hypothetical protein
MFASLNLDLINLKFADKNSTNSLFVYVFIFVFVRLCIQISFTNFKKCDRNVQRGQSNNT